MESKVYDVKPADRLATVNEYYFSRKGKEVAVSYTHLTLPTNQ